MSFMRLSVAGRVYGAFGVVIVLMIGLLVIAISGLRSTSETFDTYRSAADRSNEISSLLESLTQTRLAFAAYDGQSSSANVEALETRVAELVDSHRRAVEDGILGVNGDMDALVGAYVDAVHAIGTLDTSIAALSADMDEAGLLATETLAELITETSQSANLNARAAATSGLAMEKILMARLTAHQMADAPGQAQFDELVGFGQAAIDTLTQLRSIFFRTEDITRVDSVTTAMTDYIGLVEEMFARLSERQALQADLTAADGALVAAYAGQVETIHGEQRALGLQAHDQSEQAQMIALAGGLAILALGTVLAIIMARWMSGFVRSTASNMHELASGRLDIELPVKRGAAEFQQITRALETFRDNARVMREMDAEKLEGHQRQAEAYAKRADLQKRVKAIVDGAAAGDFSARIEVRYGDPELDDLLGSINMLMETVDRGLAETGSVLSAMASADLSKRVSGEYHGAFARLTSDTNALADAFTEVVAKLQETSRALKVATGELLTGTNDLAQRTTRQAATIEETSASMEHLSGTVSRNADYAREAVVKAESAADLAERGGKVMGQANAAMQRITTSSAKVSDVIKIIDDIAFQTNLLALNASVEAARAGEAGRGFAVVAVEVRRLAQSAAQASSEVKVLVEQSLGEVSSGTQLVGQAADTLSSIHRAVIENAEVMRAIAEASQDQNAAIDEVGTAVRALNEMTQHNAALVEETNAAIEQTEAQATDLDRIVDIFRVSEGTEAADLTAWEADEEAPVVVRHSRQA